MTTTAPPAIYRGSVKDVLGPVSVMGLSTSAVVFRYTDSYSVFDWGKMPDSLSQKGQALAILAADLFEKLESAAAWREFSKTPEAQSLRRGVGLLPSEMDLAGPRVSSQHSAGAASATGSVGSILNELGERLQATGLKTHYLGVHESEDFPQGELKPLSLIQVKKPPRYLVVRSVEIIRPAFKRILGRTVADYEMTRNTPGQKLIPLEVVFRWSCPPGSSLPARVERDPSILSGWGFPKSISETGLQPGMVFDFPVLELFTKLEPSDRPVSPVEALAIAGLSAEKMQEMLLRTAWVAGFLKSVARKAGLELADGKLEWGLSASGELILVDAIGPDELRLLYSAEKEESIPGFQLSKEFLRKFYRDTPWYSIVDHAKKEAQALGILDWKRLVKTQPPGLSQAHLELATHLYPSLTNALTGKKWFPEAPSLGQVVEDLKKIENREGAS